MPKKSKKSEPVAEEEVEEEEAAPAPPVKEKKSKKRKEPEPEPEPEEAEEEEEEEEAEEEEDPILAAKKAKKRAAARRARQRAVNYRKVARKCGFEKRGGAQAASGVDAAFFTVSASDAKRLMQYSPDDWSKGSFGKEEAEMRMNLGLESTPMSALRVTQARVESLMRNILNEATLRMVETGARKTLDAATVTSVVRPYAANMSFTAVLPPRGLIKFAQREGILSSTQADVEAADQDAAENKELTKMSRAMAKKQADEKAARKTRLEELKAARVAAA